MIKTPKKKFSLKDQLFNPQKIKVLATELFNVDPSFKKNEFQKYILKNFDQLELKQRIIRIAEALEKYLPSKFEDALKVILKALPEPCNPNLEDNDFGDFIYEPYNLYIARNACNQKQLKLGLKALEQTTQRFSAEYALRYFMRNFEKQTLEQVKKWAKHSHYHVRRLASEGIRPDLPWGGKINTDPQKIVKILDCLYSDRTRFVTRSVANNLNDISKIDLNLVLKTLKRWQKEGRQKPEELDYIIRHALRTQIKLGNQEVLSFLGFKAKSNWKIKKLKHSKSVKVGEAFNFDLELHIEKNENYIIDYILHFRNRHGKTSPKTFKLKKIVKPNETLVQIIKAHPIRPMSTKKLYLGKQAFEIQVNGQRSKLFYFELEEF